MGSRDKFSSTITCPNCQNSGTLHEWQEDGYTWMRNQDTYISSVPEGFKATAESYSDHKTPVKCITCDVLVK